MLDRFDVRLGCPSWPVNRWLSTLLRLFRPQIEALLTERDARGGLDTRASRGHAYEDRHLEVTSQLAVSVEAQVDWLEWRLGAAARRWP